MCKGPEAPMSLRCLNHREEACVARVVGARRKVEDTKQGGGRLWGGA